MNRSEIVWKSLEIAGNRIYLRLFSVFCLFLFFFSIFDVFHSVCNCIISITHKITLFPSIIMIYWLPSIFAYSHSYNMHIRWPQGWNIRLQSTEKVLVGKWGRGLLSYPIGPNRPLSLTHSLLHLLTCTQNIQQKTKVQIFAFNWKDAHWETHRMHPDWLHLARLAAVSTRYLLLIVLACANRWVRKTRKNRVSVDPSIRKDALRAALFPDMICCRSLVLRLTIIHGLYNSKAATPNSPVSPILTAKAGLLV